MWPFHKSMPRVTAVETSLPLSKLPAELHPGIYAAVGAADADAEACAAVAEAIDMPHTL